MKISRRSFLAKAATGAALLSASAHAARKNFAGVKEVRNARGRVVDETCEIFNAGAEIPDSESELSALLSEMSQAYVLKSALSVPKSAHFKAFCDAKFAGSLNENIYKLSLNLNSKILSCAMLPVFDKSAALSELERAGKSFGFFGAVIPTQIEGKILGFEDLEQILKLAQDLGMPLFAAAASPISNPVARDAEIGLFASKLAFGNKLSGLEKLKIVLPSMGGSLPFSLARNSIRAYDNGDNSFSCYLKNFYYICGEDYRDSLFDEIRRSILTSQLLFGATKNPAQALSNLRRVSNLDTILRGKSLFSRA